MELKDKLRLLRESRGLTQAQLADLLGMAASTIGQYETGDREPSYDRLKKFKEFYKVEYNFLLGNGEGDIEAETVDLREILLKNNVVFKDRPLNKKAKEGLINFLENFMEG